MPETRQRSTIIGPALEGVGYLFSAPARLPLVRTVLKEVIKVGLRTGHSLQGFAAEQGRQWRELVEEAQAESAEARAASVEEPVREASRSMDTDVLETGVAEADAAAEPSGAGEEDDDLQTLEGVGPDMAQLLRSAGIRAKRRLARRNAENLREKLVEINEREAIVSDVPSAEQIQQWIDSV